MNRYAILVENFIKSETETEWVEFKENNDRPDLIGEYISALSNTACLFGKTEAFLIYGVEDKTYEIVGTSFEPRKTKGKGNEDLEPWLSRHLSPRIDFRIVEFDYKGKKIVIFEIDATMNTPVKFKGDAYIRIGENKQKLAQHPEKERKIWKKAEALSFEKNIALSEQSIPDVLQKIDYPALCDLLKIPLPENRAAIIDRLIQESVVLEMQGSYSITNLGAILFAKDLTFFPTLARKAVRVIIYNGNSRLHAKKEQVSKKGYATGFEDLIDWIDDQLPTNELIEDALRVEKKMYPKIAIREFVANAIIHQDFTECGTSPMIEVFDTRIDMTNPGSPLIDTERFIDYPPKTRNEELASLMRRMSICEERGSGVDRAIAEVELFQLPPPLFQSEEDYTKVTLFSYKKYKDMDKIERIRVCYQHACLKWVCNESMTNASIRERLQIDKKNYPMASKIIKNSLLAGAIKVKDENNYSNKKQYIPWWA